jgi:negative regulator of flagellin synthesis FlgM
MEISRHLKPGYSIQAETRPAVKTEAAPAAKDSSLHNASAEPRLEQLQEAIGRLPDIDLDKVAAIKLALQRGEISTDSAALASSMVSYHSGSDA